VSQHDEARISMKQDESIGDVMIDKDDVRRFQATIQQGGRGKGLGLEIKMRRDGSIFITKVTSELAKEQGVKVNDTLVAINGKPLGLLHFSQIIELVRSLKEGSDVIISLAREDLESDEKPSVTTVSKNRVGRCTSIDSPIQIHKTLSKRISVAASRFRSIEKLGIDIVDNGEDD